MNLSIRLGLLSGALILPLIPISAASVAKTVETPVPTEAKPYVLYMRTDVAVEQNKKLYPVKDVHGRMFIITVRGEPVSVPMSGEGHKLEFQHKLTLARASASLTGLESGRAYTAGQDPKMKRQRDAVLAEAIIGDNASLAEGKFITSLNKGGILINSDARMPDGTAIRGAADSAAALDANSAAAAATAFQAQGQMETLRQSNITSGGFAHLAAESDMAMENFDAVEVRFNVSSAVFLEKPYVVILTRFHARDDKPGVARNAVFAKALESIGVKPTRVEVLHGGFPLGFEIEDLQVHLYNEGKEVPTDVAQKRVPLTREEAFEYLKIDYFRGHKGETMPATPAVGRPDRMEFARLGPKLQEAAYFVKVDKTGHPVSGAFNDEACSQPADEAVATLAASVRYYPALDQGKAVEGVARLVLTQLEL